MGLIRKTLSVGTLGVVSFRSKKEKLGRAERSQRAAEISLEREHAARVAAEGRITGAEKRLRRASAEAGHAAKRLDQSKRKHRQQRKAAAAEAMAVVGPKVRSGIESTRSSSTDAAKRGRKAGRRAGKVAKKSLDHALDQAIGVATAAKDAAAPHAASAASRAEEVLGHLTSHDA